MYKPFVIIALALVVAGCHSQKTADVPAPPSVVHSSELTEQNVTELARKAVQSNDTWADRAKFDAKKNADGTWSVTVWRIVGYDKDGKPQFVPGGHRFITIDRQGQVNDYVRGK